MSNVSRKVENHSNDMRELRAWEPHVLREALLTRLSARFGKLPTQGIIAGQAVASACFDLVGVGAGQMNDLDVFINESDATRFENAFTLSSSGVIGKSVVPVFSRCSFSDNLWIETMSKGGYRINFTTNLPEQPDINVIGCTSGNTPLTAEVLLSGFDLNVCEIAIDLSSSEVYWTDAFQDFLYQQRLMVTRVITPMHTAIRLLKKLRAMPHLVCDLDREMRILQMAVHIGRLCECPSKGFLATQLLSDYTVEKENTIISSLSEYFQLRDILIPLFRDGMEEQVDIHFSKLCPVSMQVQDEYFAKMCHSSFNWTNNAGVEAYVRAADLMLQLIRQQRVSVSARENYTLVSRLVEFECETVVPSDAAFERLFCQRYNLENDGIKSRFISILKWLMLRDKPHLAEICRRDVKNILKLMMYHPRLFCSLFHLNIKTLAVAANNVRSLDKKGLYFVCGLFESESEYADLFPEITSVTFKQGLDDALHHFHQKMRVKQFEGIGERFDDLWTALRGDHDVSCEELTSHWDFIAQGSSERHCVGGYYESARQYNQITLRLKHRVTGATATCLYWLDFEKPDEHGRIEINGVHRQYYAKGNSVVAPELKGVLPKNISASVKVNELPLTLQERIEKMNVGGEEISFESGVPF